MLNGRVTTTYRSPEWIEEYLQRRWPGKIEPIKRSIVKTPTDENGKPRWHIELPGSSPK
jgi:hypothetical protein